MKTPILNYVISNLDLRKGKWPLIAKSTGLSKRTIEKIARQEIKNPGIKHIEVLLDYFSQNEFVPNQLHQILGGKDDS